MKNSVVILSIITLCSILVVGYAFDNSYASNHDCDPSYPDVCIPSPPPDLDCGEIPYTNFKVLQPDPHRFDGDKDGIGCESSKSSSSYSESTSTNTKEVEVNPKEYCWGNADCFTGEVTRVIDGDTIKVDGDSIRFTLSSTPELSDYGGEDAKEYVDSVCPVGSFVIVDEDDYQTQGSYGRMIAVIWCYDSDADSFFNLNEDVLESGHAEISTYFCSQSEFEYADWAQKYGCGGANYGYSTSSEKSEGSINPSGLSAIAISSTKVRLSWVSPTSTFGQSVTGYVIERMITTGVYEVINEVDSSTNSYVVSNLQTGKTYSFVVKAKLCSKGKIFCR
jgi:endonuclease YncB( thermonuclease family)